MPARGGAPNAWFVRAAVEALTAALDGLADEVHAAVLEDPAVQARLSLSAAGKQGLEARLAAGYGAAGIRAAVGEADLDLATSWAGRLGAGRPLRVLAIDGIVDGARGNGFPPGGVKMVQMPPTRGGR